MSIGYKTPTEMDLEECYLFLEKNEGNPNYDAVKAQFEKLVPNLSLDDSYLFLQHHKAVVDNPDKYYQMVQKRYNELFEEYRNREQRSFQSCSNIKAYQRFINEYQTYAPAYTAVHIADARNKILKLKKRNRIIAIGSPLLLVLVVALFGYKPVRSLQVEDVTFGKEGGEKTIRIETNVSSNAIDLTEPETDWVNVVKIGKKLIISAIANPDPERTCTMLIEAYTTFFGEHIGTPIKQEVIVRQNSGYATNLNVSTHGFSIGKYGSSQQVNVKTDGVALELVSNKDWIHINDRNQNHDGQFYHNDDYEIIIEKNPTGQRDCKVLVTTNGQPQQEITITQASGLANSFSISTHSIGPVSKSGTKEGYCFPVDITTDGTTWEAFTNCRWLSLNKNNDRLEIEVRPADEVRDGEVYVSSNNGHQETISIHQDGDPTSFWFSWPTLTFDTDSDYKDVSFTNNSNQYVDASTNKSWLKASVCSGNIVRISCEANNGSPKDGVVTIACGNKKAEIAVHQKGWTYSNCSNCWNGYTSSGKVIQLVGYGWGGMPKYDNVQCRVCGGSGKIRHKSN